MKGKKGGNASQEVEIEVMRVENAWEAAMMDTGLQIIFIPFRHFFFHWINPKNG